MGADPQLLTEVPIFSLLDEKERATLAERVETVKFAAGASLFNRGDPGDSLYVVSSGSVEIFFKNATGERNRSGAVAVRGTPSVSRRPPKVPRGRVDVESSCR